MSDIDGERTARGADGELEGGFEVGTVIEHGTIDETGSSLGKRLQILVMSGNDAEAFRLAQFGEDGLCHGTADLGLRTRTHLIGEDQRAFRSIREEKLHIPQMGRICREVIFYRLLITYINKDLIEDADMGIIIERREESALEHILDNGDGFEAHRLTAGIRAGDNQDTAVMVEGYIQRYDLTALLSQREE